VRNEKGEVTPLTRIFFHSFSVFRVFRGYSRMQNGGIRGTFLFACFVDSVFKTNTKHTKQETKAPDVASFRRFS